MRKVYTPAIIFFAGRLFKITPEQWRRLAPEIKGLTDAERATKGRAFGGANETLFS